MGFFRRKPAPIPLAPSQDAPPSRPKNEFPTLADLCNDFLEMDALILLQFLRREMNAGRAKVYRRATFAPEVGDMSWWIATVEERAESEPESYRLDLIEWCMAIGAELIRDDALERFNRIFLGRDAFDIAS
jgi:hypothetical protein